MSDDSVYSWRSDPAKGGPSSALADIGSHWCDLAQYISGAKISEVMAELTTVVKTRYVAQHSQEAFSTGATGDVCAIPVQGEDLASVLLRFDNGAKGCFSVGQVMSGRKNAFEIELNGRAGSLRWEQEKQNELWVGSNNASNSKMVSDPMMLLPGARPYSHLPAGHQEGWSDAFRNVMADIYEWIRAEGDPEAKPATVCTFADASQICAVIEAMIRSNAAGGVWEPVQKASSESAAVELGAFEVASK
jgi:predicted dehydrogenase